MDELLAEEAVTNTAAFSSNGRLDRSTNSLKTQASALLQKTSTSNINPFRLGTEASIAYQTINGLNLDGLTSTVRHIDSLFAGVNPLNGVQFEPVQFMDDTAPPAREVTRFLVENKVMITSAAVSAGLVTWAAQYTALFSSVMATLPAWKNLDPVAILGKEDDGNDPEWSEVDDTDEEDEVDTVLSSN